MAIVSRDKRVSIKFVTGSEDVIMLIKMKEHGAEEYEEIELVFDFEQFEQFLHIVRITERNFDSTYDDRESLTAEVTQWFDM